MQKQRTRGKTVVSLYSLLDNGLHAEFREQGGSYFLQSVTKVAGMIVAGTRQSNRGRESAASSIHSPYYNEPRLEVPNGGYLCTNEAFVLELNFSQGGPYTFTYTIDGVDQSPVTTTEETYVLSLIAAEYQDSVVITSVSNEDCVGTISGLPYIRVAEPLGHTEPVVDCDNANGTYTVNFQLSGGAFGYLTVDPADGFIDGDQFTSQAIPIDQDYFIQITSGIGCDTVMVSGTPDCASSCPGLDLTAAVNGPICEGEDILLTAGNGAQTYSWTGPANFNSKEQNPILPSVTYIYSGTYQLIASDGSCSDTLRVEVVVNRPPSINRIDAPPLPCGENSSYIAIDASGSGLLEYSLDGINYSGQDTFPNLGPGSYDVYIRDATTCVNKSTYVLKNTDGPAITTLEVVPPDCGIDNGMIIITAEGGNPPLKYSMNDGGTFQDSGIFSDLGPGSYPLIVRDQSGCVISAMAVLAGGGEPPVIDEVLIEQAACAVGQNSITVEAISDSDQLTYSLDGVDPQSSNRFSELLPGSYSVRVEDENGCSVTETVNIPAIDVLRVIGVQVREADCRGNSGRIAVEAQGGAGLLTYQLDTIVQTTPEFTRLLPGNYMLTVTDASGCTYTENVTVPRGNCPIYITNAFSPNEDGINDRFAVFAASGINGQVVSYQIFNRWGHQVYQAGGFPLGDTGQWWDGTYRGKAVAAGTYAFYLVIELSGGNRIVERGEVNLLR